MLAITHYNRLLHELKPDCVHILVKGRIVASGGPELAERAGARRLPRLRARWRPSRRVARPGPDPFADPFA